MEGGRETSQLFCKKVYFSFLDLERGFEINVQPSSFMRIGLRSGIGVFRIDTCVECERVCGIFKGGLRFMMDYWYLNGGLWHRCVLTGVHMIYCQNTRVF